MKTLVNPPNILHTRISMVVSQSSCDRCHLTGSMDIKTGWTDFSQADPLKMRIRSNYFNLMGYPGLSSQLGGHIENPVNLCPLFLEE